MVQEFDPWWFHLHRLVVVLGASVAQSCNALTHVACSSVPDACQREPVLSAA